jgi:signal transduction histidine kinase/AmiR/NasT family two-component response regulator
VRRLTHLAAASRRYWTPLVAAVSAGAGGFVLNGWSLSILDNAGVVFGGLLTLPVALTLGPFWGGLAAAMAFSRMWLESGLPIGLMCYTAEAVCAGWLTRRYRVRPFSAIAIYWAIVGAPLVVAYLFWRTDIPSPIHLAAAVKFPLNSLAIVAPIVVLWLIPLLHRLSMAPEVMLPLWQILAGRFVALSAIPVVVLSLLLGHSFDRLVRARVAQRLAEDTQEVGVFLSRHLEESQRSVENLAAQLALRPAATTDELAAALEAARLGLPSFLTLLAASADGRVVASASPSAGSSLRSESVRDRDYFQAALRTRRPYMSGVFAGRGLGHDLIVGISAPVLDAAGNVVYVVEGSLNLANISGTLRRAVNGPSRVLVIVDQRQRVVAASPALHLPTLTDFSTHPLAAATPDADGTFVFALRDGASRGVNQLAATAGTGSFGWRVFLLEPQWESLRGIAFYYLATLLCAGLTVAVVVAGARRSARRITNPLNRLMEATHALALGQPAYVEPEVTVASVELSEITRSVHDAAVGLSRSNAELSRAVRERDATHQQLRLLLQNLDEKVRQRTAELDESRQAAEQANQAKSEFLASMSHELRSPLNVVLGLSEVLSEEVIGPLNARQTKCVLDIGESGRHLLALINDVLDLSKIEAGMLELDLQPTDVRQVCEASIRMVHQSAQRKSLRVELDAPDDTLLVADALRLKQMLVNLLSNAVKFTPEGGLVSLTVTRQGSPPAVVFAVRDTGIGIASKDLPRLFKSFVQIDSSLTRQHGGTGLGLALVDKMARMHGGAVTVASTVGEGSCFTVTLPLDLTRRQPIAAEPELAARPRPDLSIPGNRLVLLVDDEDVNAEMVALALSKTGCRIERARHGAEAIERTASLRPDVILMDVQMPVMDGIEATRRIRADPATAGIPIVMVTALAMAADRVRCLEAGAVAYLSKPLNVKELRRTVAEVLAAPRGHSAHPLENEAS